LNVGVTIVKLGFGTGCFLFLAQKIVSKKMGIFLQIFLKLELLQPMPSCTMLSQVRKHNPNE
jgi:hypothetical protein